MYNKNAWHKYKDANVVMNFAEDYKNFINKAKTERLTALEAEKLLVKAGFKNLKDVNKVKVGDKIYVINRKKNVAAFIIGKHPIIDGLHILGAHIDSPRLDLKQNPLYEDTGLALLDTHYYGGIKKYQWVTTPLALIGVIYKKDGSIANVNIGLDDKDPIFGVTDLLIHLAAEQLNMKLKDAISGEALDVSVASRPLEGINQEPVKANVLKFFKEKYGVEELDFTSAEIEVVPADKARDYGIDRSMVAGYGQDDRSCAYSSLRALIDADPNKIEYTSCLILTDKEETGSDGATGARSYFIENVLMEIILKSGDAKTVLDTRICFGHSKMISSDVTPASDPLYKNVTAPHRNMARFGHGVCFNKYTGYRGKRGANDADPEFIAYLREILDRDDISYQSSEIGAVDAGGGGTIAYVLAKYNMDVIDAGVPLLNMHSPLEIVSKVDLYEAYRFYKAFLMNSK